MVMSTSKIIAYGALGKPESDYGKTISLRNMAFLVSIMVQMWHWEIFIMQVRLGLRRLRQVQYLQVELTHSSFQPTHVVCVNFIREWRELQFNVDSEGQIFEKLFQCKFNYPQSLFTLRVFARNLLLLFKRYKSRVILFLQVLFYQMNFSNRSKVLWILIVIHKMCQFHAYTTTRTLLKFMFFANIWLIFLATLV